MKPHEISILEILIIAVPVGCIFFYVGRTYESYIRTKEDLKNWREQENDEL